MSTRSQQDTDILAWLQELAEANGLPMTSEKARAARARFEQLLDESDRASRAGDDQC